MSHPVEFSSYLATLPFLGRATLSRAASADKVDRLVGRVIPNPPVCDGDGALGITRPAFSSALLEVIAGEWLELTATYEVGAAGLADGAWLKLVFKFYSDWAPFQTEDPQAANYISAEYEPRPVFPGESPATVRALKVRFDQKGHERPYQKAVIIDVVDGYLKPGDRIVLRLGDRRRGGPGTRAQTFAEEAFRFRVFVDTVGASRFSPVPGDLVLAVRPGAAVRGVLLAPRLVRPGVLFPVTLRMEDVWGNLVAATTPPPAALYLWLGDRRMATLPLQWSGADGAWARGLLCLPGEGDYRLTIDGLEVDAWVTADFSAPVARALYADLHVHSDDTVGVNTTAAVLGYARDAAGLDVVGYTANDFNVRADRWRAAVAVCRELHEENRFLCFPGTEWCGASAVGGDRNVVFFGDEVRFPLASDGRSLRVFDWNEDTPKDQAQQAGLPTAADLHAAYRDLADGDRALLIPHVGGRRANFDWHDGALERLVEVASSWGHFDWFYREALARGLQVGASAAGDEHRGRPGGGAPGVGSFGTAGGLTGFLADELTSTAVARALRARHTWATTGRRAVALLGSGQGRRQGDAFTQAGPLTVGYDVLGDAGWELVELRDEEGRVLLARDLDAELGYAPGRFRVRWGGARIKDRYRWAEWHGVIEITGAKVTHWTARGLEHPEETVRMTAPGVFAIRTDTYGDADHVEFEVDDLARAHIRVRMEIDAYNKTGPALRRNPDPVTPGATHSLDGAELAARGEVTWELGGAGLFVAAERLTGRALPVRVRGEHVVEPGPGIHGHRAVYLFARERDDHKVWTSPLFITFTA